MHGKDTKKIAIVLSLFFTAFLIATDAIENHGDKELVTEVLATEAPQVTVTNTPTLTPTNTPTPAPTNTPIPTPSNTPTPTPTNTPTPIEEELEIFGDIEPYKYYEVYDYYYHSNKYHALDFKLQEYTYDLCVEYGITDYFTLILCQLFYESSYRPTAISKTDDYGIAQINTCNHEWLSKELGITDFLDPKQSILCNIYMMSGYIEKYGPEKALTKYNTGKAKTPNKYAKNIMYMWENGVREIENKQEVTP